MSVPKNFYIVTIPQGEIANELLLLQKFISRRFRMYDVPYPTLHITVGVLENGCIRHKASPVLQSVAGSFAPFHASVSGKRCFAAPYKSVGVAVHSDILACLAGRLEGSLTEAGCTVRTFSSWHFHINLINPLYARRTWSASEYREACRLVKKHAPAGSFHLDKLELWDPRFPPLRVLGKYPLYRSEVRPALQC